MSLPADRLPADRLEAFPTLGEEQWLTGSGPRPGRPADRLPERAPLLLARAGVGDWIRAARTARAWVAGDGSLIGRNPAGQDRVLVPPGQARSGWWLAGDAQAGAGLRPDPAGWLVICGTDGPLAALRLAEWLPGATDGPPGAALVRAAGAEAVCHALRVPFGSLSATAEARATVGEVPAPARFELAARPGCTALAALAIGGAALAAGAICLVLHAKTAGLVLAGIGLGLPPAADLAAWWRRRRRVRRLPRQLADWWPARPAGRAVPGRGIGRRAGPGGDELVLADGHGWEAWLAGPGAGGMAGLADMRPEPDAPPWGLVLYDREERLLVSLRAADWAAGPDAGLPDAGLPARLAPLGLAVPTVVAPAQALVASRDRAVAARAVTDLWTGLAGTRFALTLSIPLAVATLIAQAWATGGALAGWAVLTGVVRFRARRRTVL